MKRRNMNDQRKNNRCVALVMAVILFLGAFTAVITVAQPPLPQMSVEKVSIRVYGEDDMGPAPENYTGVRQQFIYTDYQDPFNPAILLKDSITFNPAIIQWDGQKSPMSAQSGNLHEKIYLRMWYEPEHIYTKPGYCYPTIEVESTYMLIDKQDWTPADGQANLTYFKFPIVEIPEQIGLGNFENNLSEGSGIEADRQYVVRLVGVAGAVSNYGKTTNGTIRIEKTYTLAPDAMVQFLDFKLQYKYLVVRNGDVYAKVKMSYAGRSVDDTETLLVLGQYDDGAGNDAHGTTWIKRHMERYHTADHSNHVTWYARFEDSLDGGVEITVGKDIQAGDTFYVNGVRYDVPAVEVIDTDGIGANGADAFKYITLRTPLPKGSGEALDDGKISSQWIVRVQPADVPPFTVNKSLALPLLPPFNQLDYTMVDDINVVLWKPLKIPPGATWPTGNPDGNPGTEYFPCAERFLTMQNPPDEWLTYFKVVPLDSDNDMNPKMPTDYQVWNGPYTPARGNIDTVHWIAYDVNERLLPADNSLQVVYIDEDNEPRYSTDLLEILNETLYATKVPYENWTKFDIQTRPVRYTEFVLPKLPDVTVVDTAVTPPLTITKPGDYLLTTSFLAPNSVNRSDLNRTPPGIPRVALAYDVDYENGVGDGFDIYVNKYEDSSSIRIYGEDNLGPLPGYGTGGVAIPYPGWQDPFDPTSLQKDSITFNPAIVQWNGTVYPMSAQSNDIDVKTFLRLWYEPDHNYSKSQYKHPTIEVETTYMLIDKQDKLPTGGSANDTFFVFPIAENESTPDVPGLELFENPLPPNEAIVPDRPNVVSLANVSGTVTSAFNKTTNGLIWLQKTYKLEKGQEVQFLDHKLTFVGIVLHNKSYYAKVKVDYAGNRDDDSGTTLTLATFNGVYDPDPHRITWFKRHSETYPGPTHYDTTWYARLENYDPSYDWAEITVGKELRAGDVFYVDGVRYDVAAIEVYDNNNNSQAEKFKYITIRTPFPKCTTPPPPYADDGIISSQWIECIAQDEQIPLLPPFNMGHQLVDDIDVELWEPLKHQDQWPTGDRNGNPGMEYFPGAEQYLTMQYPPCQWQYYFRAVPKDTDNDMNPKMPNDWQIWGGPYYPDNNTPPYWKVGVCNGTMWRSDCDVPTFFDKDHWIAYDVDERIIKDYYKPLVVKYIDERKEPRYSTNLLEKLHENVTGTALIVENWTKLDIRTYPDEYTEFVLPKDNDRWDLTTGEWTSPFHNDYLITSSFLAPNSINKSDLVRFPPGIPRVAFVFDAFDSWKKTGFYVNELVQEPPPPENNAPIVSIRADPTNVNALETVTVSFVTLYDSNDSYPLQIACNWGDGTPSATAEVKLGDPFPTPFNHSYTMHGFYTIAVTAEDRYHAGAAPSTAVVAVNNDGAVLRFSYGWNAFSAPVTDSTPMAGLFAGKVPGFFGVYSWNASFQNWTLESLGQPLDPTKGYFIWATGNAEIPLTGTAAAYSPTFLSGWNFVGVGFSEVVITDNWAYGYEHPAGYLPTRTMEPGTGYFIWT